MAPVEGELLEGEGPVLNEYEFTIGANEFKAKGVGLSLDAGFLAVFRAWLDAQDEDDSGATQAAIDQAADRLNQSQTTLEQAVQGATPPGPST